MVGIQFIKNLLLLLLHNIFVYCMLWLRSRGLWVSECDVSHFFLLFFEMKVIFSNKELSSKNSSWSFFLFFWKIYIHNYTTTKSTQITVCRCLWIKTKKNYSSFFFKGRNMSDPTIPSFLIIKFLNKKYKTTKNKIAGIENDNAAFTLL